MIYCTTIDDLRLYGMYLYPLEEKKGAHHVFSILQSSIFVENAHPPIIFKRDVWAIQALDRQEPADRTTGTAAVISDALFGDSLLWRMRHKMTFERAFFQATESSRLNRTRSA